MLRGRCSHASAPKAMRVRVCVCACVLKNRDHSADLGLDGRIILDMDPKETGWEGMYWFDLAQDRDRLRAVVNIVMIFQVVKG